MMKNRTADAVADSEAYRAEAGKTCDGAPIGRRASRNNVFAPSLEKFSGETSPALGFQGCRLTVRTPSLGVIRFVAPCDKQVGAMDEDAITNRLAR